MKKYLDETYVSDVGFSSKRNVISLLLYPLLAPLALPSVAFHILRVKVVYI